MYRNSIFYSLITVAIIFTIFSCANDDSNTEKDSYPNTSIHQWGDKEGSSAYFLKVNSEDSIYTVVRDDKYFLIKFDSDLKEKWRKELPDEYMYFNGTIGKFTIAKDNNIYIPGHDSISKFDKDGNLICSTETQFVDHDNRISVVVDSSNNFYTAGVTFAVSSYPQQNNIILIKYNENCEKEWSKEWGTIGFNRGKDLVIDSDNNLYITGFTDSDLNGNTHKGGNGGDIFLMKTDSQGNEVWTKQWGTDFYDTGDVVTIDKDNNLYILGSLDYEFLEKRDSDANVIWTTKLAKSMYSNEPNSLVLNNDSIYVTGSFYDGDSYKSFKEFDKNGKLLFSKALGEEKGLTAMNTEGLSIDKDSKGNLYILGETYSDLGGLFLIKLEK